MLLSFLYMIATVCTAYVGFTSLFVFLRKSGEQSIDQYSSWSIRYLIAVALSTMGTTLLPAVLLAFNPDERQAVRIASFVALFLLGRLDVIYASRSKLVDSTPVDWRLRALFFAAVAIDVLFGLIAFGVIEKFATAVYMALELGELVVMFCYFAWALQRLLPLEWEREKR